MKSKSLQELRNNQLLGLSIISIFTFWVLITEYGPTFLEQDLGSFIWTTFHFIINPVLSLVTICILIWHATGKGKAWVRALSLFGMIIPIIICYAGISGSIWFVELLGVNFN